MTDEELISTLWSGEVTLSTAAAAAVRIKELLRDLKSVLEREAETQVRHEAREDAIREAALREAAVLATSLSSEWWAEYKNIHSPHRADPHYQGMSDGADDVAHAILKRHKACNSYLPQERWDYPCD